MTSQARSLAWKKAVAICPEDASWLQDLGVAYGLATRWPVSVKAFETCLSLDSGYAQARAGYALALFETGRVEEALGEAQKALISLRPGSLTRSRTFLS